MLKNKVSQSMKVMISMLLIVIMIALTAIVAVNATSSSTAKAAAKPTISKKSRNILIGKKYNLNINNKVAKSKYKWTSSNKDIATVDNRGIVTAKSKGKVDIACIITTPDKIDHRVSCKVTVREPAMVFRIRNKVSALNLGQEYDLNRMIGPSSSNDKTTWTTSDETIAKPDSMGRFIALKEGKVTITGTTMSGKSDSVTITVVDKEGIVTNQEELDTLVGSGVELVTIKTDEELELDIKGGKHLDQTLVVDAPNADIRNRGVFKSIEIKQVKGDTWYERAVGNLLRILDKDVRIVIASYANVSIEVNEENAVLRIENNGKIEEIILNKKSELDISGYSEEDVPVTVNVPNIKIKTSVPLNLVCNERIELEILPGAEKTTVKARTKDLIPTITGITNISVVIGDEEEVAETPVSGGSGGGPGAGPGPGPGTDPTPEDSKTYYIIDSMSGERLKLNDVFSLTVVYGDNIKILLPADIITSLKDFLQNQNETIIKWKDIKSEVTKKYENIYFNSINMDIEVKISPVAGDELKKKVDLPLLGSYEVRVNANTNSVTVKAISSGKTYEVQKLDDYSIKISPAPVGLKFLVPAG